MKGIVKWFNEQKGYGFIAPEDKSPDVFVHYSAINNKGFRTLIEGEPVEFELEDTGNVPKAKNVTRLEARSAR